jgi:hypothetical protein
MGILLINGILGFAQKQVALNHNGLSNFYSRIDSAVINAQNGDTIYIPGGNFNIGELVINKEVIIYGAGIHPDTTNATGISYLSGNLYLVDGSDSSFIQGLSITGNITFGTDASNQAVENVTISRCKMNSLNIGFSPTLNAKNILVSECLISGDINGNSAQNILITNSIITGLIAYFNQNAVFSNNVFLRQGDYWSSVYVIRYSNEVTFSNNVFLDESGYVFGCTASLFQNNLFAMNYTFPVGDNTGSGNIVNQPRSGILVNQTGNSFSFAHDYHLQPTCAGVNAGTDGHDLGIFGGSSPFKIGNNPLNPHIRTKNIGTSTNANGKLNININVDSQDR